MNLLNDSSPQNDPNMHPIPQTYNIIHPIPHHAQVPPPNHHRMHAPCITIPHLQPNFHHVEQAQMQHFQHMPSFHSPPTYGYNPAYHTYPTGFSSYPYGSSAATRHSNSTPSPGHTSTTSIPDFGSPHSVGLGHEDEEEEEEEEEVNLQDKPIIIGKNKNTYWKQVEDVLLIKSWVNISTNPVIGVDEKKSDFRDSVAERFKQYSTPGARPRTVNTMSSRWYRATHDMSVWADCPEEVIQINPSGKKEEDFRKTAHALYVERHKKHYKFKNEHW